MNWILGAAAVLILGPPILRKIAENPDAVRAGADTIEAGRGKLVEYGKRGASAAYEAAKAQYEQRRASQVGAFAGYLR